MHPAHRSQLHVSRDAAVAAAHDDRPNAAKNTKLRTNERRAAVRAAESTMRSRGRGLELGVSSSARLGEAG